MVVERMKALRYNLRMVEIPNQGATNVLGDGGLFPHSEGCSIGRLEEWVGNQEGQLWQTCSHKMLENT